MTGPSSGPGRKQPEVPFGQQRRPWNACEPEPGRRLHLGGARLDGGGVDEAADLARDRASVVGQDGDAGGAQPGRDVAVLPLIEGAIGALDLMPSRPYEAGERRHAGASDS